MLRTLAKVIHGETMRGQMRAVATRDAQARRSPGAANAPAFSQTRRHVRGAALWATVGFVLGAVFWHAIGFWTFMSQLTFDRSETVAAQSAPAGDEIIETGSLPTIVRIDPASCTSLELDRTSNRTAERPCPHDGLALRHETGAERGNLARMAASDLR